MTITQAWLNAHPEDEAKLRDSFCTPLEWAQRVGEFDYDVCTNPLAHIIARRKFILPKYDGLKLARFVPRNARVWCNPPYSRGMVAQFIEAYAHTRFVFLVRYSPDTKWFARLYELTSLIAQPMERINFEAPPGIDIADNNPYPHAFFYRDPSMVTDAIAATCALLQPVRR